MDDGTRISLTVYLPATGEGPFPTIVESVPYRKDDTFHSVDWSTYAYLANRGFAGVRIDIRGTGNSSGILEDEYLEREQLDTLAVLDWVENQDWSTGNIGMWGVSWGGFSALQTAMLRPKQLKAIAPVHATHDRFACDVHYAGGSLHAQEQADWPTSMVICNALPPDPEIFGQGWREEWFRRLEGTPQWPGTWLRHQTRDDYWMHGSPAADYGSIECPTLLIGGWLDGYVDGMLALAEHLTCETRTVIGPWGHYRPATGVPGPTMDHLDLLARWFGHQLRGDDNGVMEMAAVTTFIRRRPPYDGELVDGEWHTASEWPPSGVTAQVIELEAMEHGATKWDGPQWVGRHAPAWDRAGIGSAESTDDDQASMSFGTGAFEHEVEILGTPVVSLSLWTDDTVGMVAARLIVLDPAGEGHLITRGSRNLSFPDDLSDPRRIRPGQPVRVAFPLLATSAVIPAGWSLRLSLAGADFPVVWPPGRRFTLDIDPSESRLTLPVAPPRSPTTRVMIPESASPPSSPAITMRDEQDGQSIVGPNQTLYTRTIGDTVRLPDRNGLIVTSDQWWSIAVDDDDPATTKAWSEGSTTLRREGWNVGASGRLEITANDHDFLLTIDLTATEDGEVVHRATTRERVPRVWA
jgi:uncharacterized protein